MAGNFKELLKKAEAEKRQKAGLDPLPEEETLDQPTASACENEENVEESSDQIQEDEPDDAEDEETRSPLVRIILFSALFIVCAAVIYISIIGILDFTALGKSDKPIEVEIPVGASNEEIANILSENDLIDHPFIFRIYSKLSGKGSAFQAGTYTLSPDLGYDGLAAIFVEGNPRETVSVTIPEGYTIEQIAVRLEEAEVCTAANFYDALVNGTYNYDFMEQIPTITKGGDYEYRLYRLEGYLFPDTYEFFKETEAVEVVDRFLQNFDSKLTADMRKAIEKRGATIDDIVIMASIAQREAASAEEMPKVVRVLENRLNSDYTRLECDSTYLYVGNLPDTMENADKIYAAYNTYDCKGLPVGAIGNPGFAALKAAIYPSKDNYIAECFYFANDSKGNTYYSKTFEQHKAVCRQHGIGIYG